MAHRTCRLNLGAGCSNHLKVLHVPSLKPLDEQTIINSCRQAGRLLVVAENHSVMVRGRAKLSGFTYAGSGLS